MHTSEASSGSNTPATGNGTRRRRKELLGFKLQEGETRIPIGRHRLISWLISAKNLLGWRSVTTKWCLTNVWKRGSWARKKSEDVSITTEPGRCLKMCSVVETGKQALPKTTMSIESPFATGSSNSWFLRETFLIACVQEHTIFEQSYSTLTFTNCQVLPGLRQVRMQFALLGNVYQCTFHLVFCQVLARRTAP